MAIFRWPRWDPLGTMRYMQREMDRWFGRGSAGGQRVGGGAYPPVNVLNGPDDLVVQCEIPGVARDDLELSITGETLVIRGTKNPPADEETVRFQLRERGAGQFNRTIVLPDRVDGESVAAALKDGLLTIRLPKAESAKPRQIAVQ